MKSAPGTQPALGSVVVFQVVNSPPWASTAHSCSRPSGSGATATCDAAAGSGPVSAQASAHGTQPALGSVVVFQVVNSPPWASTAHSCSRPSDSGATATCDAAAGSGPVSARKSAWGEGAVVASTQGWSSGVRSTSTVIRPGPAKFALRRMFIRPLLSPRRTPAYRTPELPPNRTEMSLVPKLTVPPGMTEFSCQVVPPSVEKKYCPVVTGTAVSGVNAEMTICRGFAGSTAMLGSESKLVSPLLFCGMMLITRSGIASPYPSLTRHSKVWIRG